VSAGSASFSIDRDSHIARIRISRPERRNMIDVATGRLICDFLDQVEDDDDVTAVLLSGEGPDLSAGWDVTDVWSMYIDAPGGAVKKVPSQRARLIAVADNWWGPRGLYSRLLHCRKVTILEAQGDCFETGLFFALCCDLTIAAENARFGCPRWHTLGADGDLSLLIAAVGLKRAKDLMYTAVPWTASQALDYGLVDWLVPEDELTAKAVEIADMCASIMRDGIVSEKYALFASLEKMGVGLSFAASTIVASSLSNIHFQPGEFNFLAEMKRAGEASAVAASRAGLDQISTRED
jgi:enoyl-CoA hydratase